MKNGKFYLKSDLDHLDGATQINDFLRSPYNFCLKYFSVSFIHFKIFWCKKLKWDILYIYLFANLSNSVFLQYLMVQYVLNVNTLLFWNLFIRNKTSFL